MTKCDGASPNPLPDGYFMMPPGKLANAVTYLEMSAQPSAQRSLSAPSGCRLEPLTGADAQRYASLYRAVGEPWLWASHLAKTEAQLAAMLDDATLETFALIGPPGDIGIMQLAYDGTASAEVVYFGLVLDAVGMGLGTWMIQEATQRAFARPVRRLWLHTCNFDHPASLNFYKSIGFTVYATGFEIMDDPRATGLLPPAAAPHVPLVLPRSAT